MKLHTQLAPWLAAFMFVTSCPVAQGHEPSEIDSTDVFYRHLNLQELVVTGATGETRLRNAAAPISVLDERELRSLPGTNIVDAIASLPGVSQITTGAGIAKPVIRGLGYNRIVVVNDGMRQEGQQWGDEHGIEIDGLSVGSVEVLKGPASLVYGSDALAGVVKFNRRRSLPDGTLGMTLHAEYQTNNGLLNYALNCMGSKNRITWDALYSEKIAHEYRNRHDGYVPNSQFHERALSGCVGTNRSWGKTLLTLSHYHLTPSIIEGERDATTGELEVPYDKLKTYHHGLPFQQVYHSKAVSNSTFYVGQGRLNVLFGYQQNRRKEFEESATDCGLYLKLHTINYNAHYVSREYSGWHFTGGMSGMWQCSRNNGDEYLIPDYELTDVGGFITAERQWERITLTGGVRYDHRHMTAHELTDDGDVRFTAFKRNFGGVCGSVGGVYHAGEKVNVRVNVSRGFRAPNISELASNGIHEGAVRYEVGNVQLKPEFSTQVDLGCDVTTRFCSLQLALFSNRINNYIFLHRTGAMTDDNYPIYDYAGGDAQLLGGELSADFHPLHCLHIGTSVAMVSAVQLHQPRDTRYLPFTPAPRWQCDVKYEFGHHGRLFCNSYVSLGLDYNFKQSHYYRANDTETATPAYALLNAALGTDVNHHGHHIATIHLLAGNLTNRVYQSHLSRLKYADAGPDGRQGVFNMGWNLTLKVSVPITVTL